jgi:hypothetical protein
MSLNIDIENLDELDITFDEDKLDNEYSNAHSSNNLFERKENLIFDDEENPRWNESVLQIGWLKKRGSISTFWRDRYFVLERAFLHYYRNPEDALPRGSLKIQAGTVVDVVAYAKFERDFVFQIKRSDTARIYYIQASNELDRSNWIAAIRRQVDNSKRYEDHDKNSPAIVRASYEYDEDFGVNSARGKRMSFFRSLVSQKDDELRDTLLPANNWALEQISIFETPQKLFIMGSDVKGVRFRFITIDRTVTNDLVLNADNSEYSRKQAIETLNMLVSANEKFGAVRMQKTASACGIVGFIRFIQGYYIILITKRKKVGYIGSHPIYTIVETSMLPVWNNSFLLTLQKTKEALSIESKYRSRFQLMELNKNFYYSNSYDLTRTLQYNRRNPGHGVHNVRKIFAWNSFLLQGFKKRLGLSSETDLNSSISENNWQWVIHLVYGFFEQVSCNVVGHLVEITLLSRRSSMFAGTRYLKRGCNEEGYCGNDVETEQIVFERESGSHKEGQFTSYVQVRASIPLYWSQESNAMVARPPIVIQKVDPMHSSMRKHFERLFARYGSPILVLNLVKNKEKQPRESKVGRPFGEGVNFLNESLPQEHKIDYMAWDFKQFSKLKNQSVVDELMMISEWVINRTGLYHSNPRYGARQVFPADTGHIKPDRKSLEDFLNDKVNINLGHTQRGVCRSNCIDSLDRTNVAQFCIGKCALGYQLYAMNLIDKRRLEADSPISKVILDLYERMGDCLALQYGGSHMHRQMQKDRHMTSLAPVLYRNEVPAKPKEIFVSIMRHYQNSFQDSDKQDAINLFLGKFVPDTEQLGKNIWDHESDYYMHNKVLNLEPFKNDAKSSLVPGNWWSRPIENFEYEVLGKFSRSSNNDGDEDASFDLKYEPYQMTSFDEILEESPNLLISIPTMISGDFRQKLAVLKKDSNSMLLSPIKPPPAPPVQVSSTNASFLDEFQVTSHQIGERVLQAIRRLVVRKNSQHVEEQLNDNNSLAQGLSKFSMALEDHHLLPFSIDEAGPEVDALDFVLKNWNVYKNFFIPKIFSLAVPSHLAFSNTQDCHLSAYLNISSGDCIKDRESEYEEQFNALQNSPFLSESIIEDEEFSNIAFQSSDSEKINSWFQKDPLLSQLS